MKSLTFVEIDVDFCSLTYGTAPCTASIGVTGSDRCYNTRPSCQDAAHFANSPLTLRFALDVDYLPDDIDCIPCMKSVNITPSTVGLGSGLGQRATVKAVFRDHRHSDVGIDKYAALRSYNPYNLGTFFAKLRHRHVYLVGKPLRVISGVLGQSLASMTKRSFIIDSFNGPSLDGTFEINAKDVLKLADGKRAQCPPLSEGQLLTGLTTSSTTFTVTPVGAGALYPSSGYVAIGGEEVCSFTRSGDTFTITRAQLGTVASAHTALDRVQNVVTYLAMSPANILYDLLTTYGNVPTAYITLTDWTTEVSTYLARFLTAHLVEPTDVSTLISEICEQCQLALWWDEVNQKIRLKVLRDVSVGAPLFNEDQILVGTFKCDDQPSTRVSETWFYYGIRNPLESASDPKNFRSVSAIVDLQNESLWGTPSIKKVFSRWVASFGGAIASALAARIVSRYTKPPRRITASLFNSGLLPGDEAQFSMWMVQDFSGAQTSVPALISRVASLASGDTVEAEEMVFTSIGVPTEPSLERLIVVDSNINEFNLLTVHNSLYPAITSDDVALGVTVRCVINAGVIVGSSGVTLPSFTISGFVSGLPITLEVVGRIQGAGGKAWRVDAPGAGAVTQAGGTALYVRNNITLIDASGQIWGGGGSGGSRYNSSTAAMAIGGGGAGTVPGTSTNLDTHGTTTYLGSSGTDTAGGSGGSGGTMTGGAGGDPGLAGGEGSGLLAASAAGAAGKSIDGISYVTTSGSAGDRRGTTSG